MAPSLATAVTALGVAITVLSPVSAFSQAPAKQSQGSMPTYVEELFRSEAVRNEEKGELQTTLATEAFRKNGADAQLEFEYGLTQRWQLSAEVPYGFRTATQAEEPFGWSTVSVGTEYQLVRSSHPFALTAGLGVNLPINSRGEFAWEPELLAAKQLGRVQLHASFLAELANDSHEYEYNIASVINLHTTWFPTLEFNGRRTDSGANLFYLTSGIYRHFHHRMEAGAAVSAGSHLGIVGKITWEIGGDKD